MFSYTTCAGATSRRAVERAIRVERRSLPHASAQATFVGAASDWAALKHSVSAAFGPWPALYCLAQRHQPV